MLRSLKNLRRYDIRATDGDVGRARDFLFDDVRWVIRYLVVDTGGFFSGRPVLLAPVAFRGVDFSASRFWLNLTMEKIRSSPGVDLHRPVSRQHEREYYGYYGYRSYWQDDRFGARALDLPPPVSDPPRARDEPPADHHLRSAKEIMGYHIVAADGSIGHVADVVVDDETWQVRYLVLDTANWWSGKRVLVAPEWATRISWADQTVRVRLTRDEIRRSPAWGGTFPVDREYQDELARHYGGIPGWSTESRPFDSHEGSRPGSHGP